MDSSYSPDGFLLLSDHSLWPFCLNAETQLQLAALFSQSAQQLQGLTTQLPLFFN